MLIGVRQYNIDLVYLRGNDNTYTSVLSPPFRLLIAGNGSVEGVPHSFHVSGIKANILLEISNYRRCPSCKKDALERMDSETTIGVRCTRCGYADAEESAWLFAEEEGPLEELVLEQRRARKSLSGGSR